MSFGGSEGALPREPWNGDPFGGAPMGDPMGVLFREWKGEPLGGTPVGDPTREPPPPPPLPPPLPPLPSGDEALRGSSWSSRIEFRLEPARDPISEEGREFGREFPIRRWTEGGVIPRRAAEGDGVERG